MGVREAIAPTPFTTPTLAPTIESTFAGEVSSTIATLDSEINPSGSATNYRFEYGPTSAYGTTVLGKDVLPAVDQNRTVSATISGLHQGTTYHYRVIATNSVESVAGPDKTITTFAEAPASASCPNEIFRTGPSALLPDCRAYEQASPTQKHGADAQGYPAVVQASESGDAVTFGALAAITRSAGGQTFPIYVSRRGETAWSTAGLLPPSELGERARFVGWTSDLDFSFTAAGPNTEPARAPGLLEGNTLTGSYTSVYPPKPGLRAQTSTFVAASPDGSTVYFQNRGVNLASGAAVGQENLYVWNRETGQIKVAGALPDEDCETAPCAGGRGICRTLPLARRP